MKFNAKKGKLVTLFAKAYFGFSLTVLGCVLLVFWASDRYYDHMLLTPDMDAAAEDVHMISSEYEKVNCFRYFGKNGGFAVFDPEGSLLYRDEKNFPYLLDIDEVLCVPDYDDFSFINSYELDVAQSGGEYLVVKTIYRENSDETETKQMLLDQDYHVISGPLQKNKMQYTAREYSILTGSFPEDAELLRHTMPDGRILVAAAKKWHVDDYTTVSRRANMIYWVLLPVSLLLITFFILFLNKRVKNPLIQLSAAINRMAAGGAADAHVGMVNGPYEMQAIARNFDRMADQLAESEAERRRLDADKQKLLTDISHDLKTPITVICGYTRAIADGKVPQDKLAVYLQLIDDKAEELNDLLNSFYEYNKVNHPEFRVQPVVADVCEFLREYLAKRYDEINLAGFALRISIPEKMILCAIDQPMMTRALNNIIYNAMQYNALGTVMGIKIVETEERNKPNTIAIRLADNGVGIAPERRARIFEPFVTGTDSRSSEGSGLGLAITKKIIEAHGGTITLLDKPSPGFSTEFEILLPAVL